MRSTTLSAFAVTTTLCVCTSAALAGDYNSGVISGSSHQTMVSKGPVEHTTQVEYGSGWYLRGDIGLSAGESLDVSFSRAARSGDANASSENQYSAGIGVGYFINDHLRADFLFDIHAERDWSGNASGCGVDGTNTPYTGDCTSSDSGMFDGYSGMMNVYANLGTINGFTPYVGAGIGLTNVNYGATTSTLRCTVDPGENCDLGTHSGATTNPETFTGSQTFEGGNSLNLTYALTAGFDYRLNDQWTMDVGYRMTQITEGKVFGATSGSGSVEFDGAQLHEVRLGLRYEVW